MLLHDKHMLHLGHILDEMEVKGPWLGSGLASLRTKKKAMVEGCRGSMMLGCRGGVMIKSAFGVDIAG